MYGNMRAQVQVDIRVHPPVTVETTSAVTAWPYPSFQIPAEAVAQRRSGRLEHFVRRRVLRGMLVNSSQ